MISSIGARIAPPGAGIYYASNAAVSSFAMSLAMELEPFGIKVTAVELGGMRTRFAEASSLNVAEFDPAYDPTVGATFAMMQSENYSSMLSDPKGHAALVIKVAEMDEPPVRILAGVDAFTYGTQFDAVRAAMDAKYETLSRLAAL